MNTDIHINDLTNSMKNLSLVFTIILISYSLSVAQPTTHSRPGVSSSNSLANQIANYMSKRSNPDIKCIEIKDIKYSLLDFDKLPHRYKYRENQVALGVDFQLINNCNKAVNLKLQTFSPSNKKENTIYPNQLKIKPQSFRNFKEATNIPSKGKDKELYVRWDVANRHTYLNKKKSHSTVFNNNYNTVLTEKINLSKLKIE